MIYRTGEKSRAGENCLQMPATTNPDLLNNGKWGVGRRSSPKCFACNGTFENRPLGYSRGEANTAQPLQSFDRGGQSLGLLGFEVRARDSGAYGQKAHYREDG